MTAHGQSWPGRRCSSCCSSLTQATLGAFVVLSGLQPIINTLHVVNGALVLGTSLVLTLRAFRPVIEARRVCSDDPRSIGGAAGGAPGVGVHGSTRGREARS